MPHPLSSPGPRAVLIAVIGMVAAIAFAIMLPASEDAGARTTFTCDKKPATLTFLKPGEYKGTEGDDVIVGSNGPDSIRGLAGRDTICGMGANDHLNGGQDGDDVFGDAGDDLLRGRGGQDELDGGPDSGDNKSKRGEPVFDRCFGGKPNPDTKQKHDIAFGCEEVEGAFTPS